MARLGLFAGADRLPVEVAMAARERGDEVVALCVSSDFDREIARYATSCHAIGLGELSRALEILEQEKVDKVVWAGKVHKSDVLTGFAPDHVTSALLASVKDFRDDTLMNALVEFLASRGFPSADQRDYLAGLLAEPGVLTRRGPDGREEEDIAFGLPIARAVAGMDIGQTIVVKSRAVVAVEAAEGTDETIRRSGKVSGPGAVVIKVEKPRQNPKFDVPTVGTNTVRAMAEAGATCLALEAGKTFIVDRERFLREAEESGIAVVSVAGPTLGG